MRFEWDEEKRLSNIAKHGFDFIRAARLFDGKPGLDAQSGSTLSLPVDGRQDFKRWRTGGVMIAVAWTQPDADVCRIISVRRARDEEKRQYQQIHG